MLRVTPPETGPDLSSIGFTESEATSFSALWYLPFFDKINLSGWANLIYRLPQSKYDELASLEVDPEPDEIVRAMYVLVHLGE